VLKAAAKGAAPLAGVAVAQAGQEPPLLSIVGEHCAARNIGEQKKSRIMKQKNEALIQIQRLLM